MLGPGFSPQGPVASIRENLGAWPWFLQEGEQLLLATWTEETCPCYSHVTCATAASMAACCSFC
jgi:hypothetical protein